MDDNFKNQIISLKEFINFSTVKEQDQEHFINLWKPFEAKRKEVITRFDEQELYLYFVTEGVQRVFYADSLSREATLVLSYPLSFGGVLDSMLLKQPSAYCFEALTNSKFLRCRFADLRKLAENSVELNQFIQTNIHRTLSGLLKRMVELQCYSSEDKFRALLKRSPQILKLVPHKYLANYLGIDPTNFSKFINSIKI